MARVPALRALLAAALLLSAAAAIRWRGGRGGPGGPPGEGGGPPCDGGAPALAALAALRRAAPVLLVSHDLMHQGAQIFLHRLAAGLRARGWRTVDVLAPRDGPLRPRLEADGFAVHVAPDADVAGWLRTRGRPYAVVQHNTVLTCHAHLHAPGGPLAHAVAVWSVHESDPTHPGLALNASCPPAVLAASFAQARTAFGAHSTREAYRALGWLHPSLPSPVVRYGLDPGPFDAAVRIPRDDARRRLGIPADGLAVLSLGTLCPRKGQLGLVRAFARVVARRRASGAQARDPARLYLVGAERHEYIRWYEDLVEREAAPLGPLVAVVNSTADAALLRLWMRAADVHALNSAEESMPLVCMETMAAGVPQVAARVYGIPELVRDGRDGVLYEHGGNGTEALEAALERVLGDRGERERMGKEAAGRVREAFSIARMAEGYEALYMEGLLARK
ncbi:hypothetical protein DFJ74DRAFT_645265 [Hyaloraphidium curvatum]|nr:hypothetical protein DFJ74DRAFT_645265 [Hyaloraphidium curvatum]